MLELGAVFVFVLGFLAACGLALAATLRLGLGVLVLPVKLAHGVSHALVGDVAGPVATAFLTVVLLGAAAAVPVLVFLALTRRRRPATR